MMKHRPLAVAIALACGLTASPLVQALCRPGNTLPFTAGPASPVHGFAEQVVDSEGVALVICTDSVDGQGNPPPCFFDPVIPGNATSEANGFGGEGFWFLAGNTITTTGNAAVNAEVVMATEAAYATEVPAPGDQFAFTRFRVRMDIAQPGIYTLMYPWGIKQYVVTAAGRRAVNETIDTEFTPGGSRTGTVGPWLRWDPSVTPAAPAGYIGDGTTPHRVIGSPCGQNYVRISATMMDGRTPIAIDPTDADRDGSTSGITNMLFTVQGKLAPQAITPLAVNGAYYAREGSNISITTFATAPSTASLTATPGGNMSGDGNGRFFTSLSVPTVPTSVQVTATNASQGNSPNTQNLPVTDLVTISRAQAVCSVTTRTCALTVNAASSDKAATGAPTLRLTLNNAALVNGAVSINGLSVLPPTVTVTSSAGGQAVKPLTVINQ